MGFTGIWLPPALEASGPSDVGYGIKNWFSFDNTKYGDETELRGACEALNNENIEVYHDTVHNHLMGGEAEHDVLCLHVKKNNKNEPIQQNSVPFRATVYSGFSWLGFNHANFDAYHPNDHDVWALSGKKFDREAHLDPLIGCDLDFDNFELVQKLEESGHWFRDRILVDGYRFDAVKHIRPKGTLNFLTAMRRGASRALFAVGEFLDENIDLLHEYIGQTLGQISLFDFPLQRKLVLASQARTSFDMGSLHTRTLTSEQPTHSVPFVHSHDDQPSMHGGDHRGHYIGDWFISQAYAMVLLRNEGYPLVSNVDVLRHENMIRRYILARTNCTFGHRHDAFDHAQTVGWSFSGHTGFDNAMAVVITTGDHGRKWLPVGKAHVAFRDLTEALDQTIWTNEHGWAEFECPRENSSVWVEATKWEQLMGQLRG
ncbi:MULTISPECIES: alpha-amylase family glycosyl hydrolase [unclassified Synechococcus]|uniref:alpha-amylase family glycosyl hydrolase n=1 Tax=Synechococcales TaxID=1890424 RepID=UPI001627D31B|nr:MULTISPECIES: alpha-amylase family glycosyl hydrolase [unclassified Synechococcus]